MAKTTPTNPFAEFDVTQMLERFKVPGLDMDQIMDAQRKNVQALNDANRVAVSGLQALTQRQTEIFGQAVESMNKAVQELSSASNPQELSEKQVALAKEAFETAVANMRELAEMMAKANSETMEVVNKRVNESVQEMQELFSKLK